MDGLRERIARTRTLLRDTGRRGNIDAPLEEMIWRVMDPLFVNPHGGALTRAFVRSALSRQQRVLDEYEGIYVMLRRSPGTFTLYREDLGAFEVNLENESIADIPEDFFVAGRSYVHITLSHKRLTWLRDRGASSG